MQDNIDYCRNQVAQKCSDLYLVSLCGHASDYKALWAIFAFHSELMGIRDRVREPTLGLMRLVWWRETIKGLVENIAVVPAHPVACALADQVMPRLTPVSQELFFDMLDAHEKYMEEKSETALSYAEDIFSPLFRLIAVLTGAEMKDDADVRRLAHAYGAALGERQDLTDVVDAYLGAVCPKVKVFCALHALIRIYSRRQKANKGQVDFPKYKNPPPFLALRVWAATFFGI